MPNRVIISDTTILIAFEKINSIELLEMLYEEIVVTPEVKEEFGESLPNWIKVQEVSDNDKMRLLELELDLGESSAIALALEHPKSLLIIDEKKGRKIAKAMGIDVTGTLGILVKAKKKGVLEKVKPVLDKLESVNFRISPSLRALVLNQVDENE